MTSVRTILAAGLLLTAACHAADNVKSEWNVRNHVPENHFLIQSHRGAGDLAPENTLEAFQLGWKLGTVAECDVRTTKDGVIVTFHDNNFARVVRGASEELKKKKVSDVTWDELKKLDVGAYHGEEFTGRRVSKLTEAFALMQGHPDRRMYLDIKDVDLKQLAAEVNEYKVGPQVTLASTKNAIIHEWKSLVPDSQTLLWMGGTEEKLTQRFAELRKDNFKDVTQVQIHIYVKEEGKVDGPDPFKLPDAFLLKAGEELRQHGILYQTLPWYTTDKHVYWKLMDLGVQSFATDHPDITWEAIREYYQQKQK